VCVCVRDRVRERKREREREKEREGCSWCEMSLMSVTSVCVRVCMCA